MIMVIGIDGNEANVEKKVGSNVYAHRLLSEFAKLDAKNKFTVYLKNPPLAGLPSNRPNFEYRVVGPRFFWTRLALPGSLVFSRRRPNVFFSPGHYAPAVCPSPLAVSVLDLSFLYFPKMFKPTDLYKLRHWTSEAVRCASRIFTISRHSRQDIINCYGVDPGKVIVTYPGYDEKLYSTGQNSEAVLRVKEKYQIRSDYLLSLGTLQPRKNLVRLIRSLSRLPDKSVSLVIAGKKGWYYRDIFSEVKNQHLENRVIFTGYVSESEKPALLAGAKALVLVSLYEGFGLPVVEAMAAGVPAVVSDNSCLSEISGSAGIKVDPQEVDSIARGLKTALELTERQKHEIIDAGRKIIKNYSWRTAAQKTLEELYAIAV